MIADFATQVAQEIVYVSEAGSILYGFIVCYAKQDHFQVENIAVDPQFHRKGLGRELLAFAEDTARKRGFDRLELYTNEKMWENIKYYPKQGFEEFARRREDGFARVYYRKNL